MPSLFDLVSAFDEQAGNQLPAASAPTNDPFFSAVEAFNSPQPTNAQATSAWATFPSVESIRQATTTGMPGSPEMKGVEDAANYAMQAMVTSFEGNNPSTAMLESLSQEQLQALQYAQQVMSQNPNYPQQSGVMQALNQIAHIAVPLIIGAGIGGVLGAPAGATSAAPAVEGLGGLTSLGGTISAAPAAGGLGTGITAGATGASGISAGGATGTTALSGTLAPGSFAAESLYPVVGGQTAAALGGSAATTAAGGTALQRILDGVGTTQDYLSLAGQVAPSLLGIYASNRQTDALQGLADRYFNMGAPYRDELARISTDPNAFYSGPQATKATESVLQRLSKTTGNPAGSPYAQALTVDALFNEYGAERDRLAGFGGLTAYNSAAPGAATSAVNSRADIYNAIGGGIADVTTPRYQPRSLQEIFRAGGY